MKHISALSVVLLVILAAGICHGDSLVISYRSGKTQTIILEEPSQTINSWQVVDATPTQEQIHKTPILQPESNSVPTDNDQKKKPGARVKWNAKPIPD